MSFDTKITKRDVPSVILIVDDEERGCQALEILLAGQGYKLLFAHNGLDALEIASGQTPDLILLDVIMPGMDGFEVCRRIRNNADLAEVPVIMITSLDDKESCLEGIEAGADEFISKPFDKLELRARVRTVTRLNRFRNMVTERSKFQSVIEFAPDGIMIVDADMTIVLANPAMRRMLNADDGKSLDTLKADAFIPSNRAPAFREMVRNILNKSEGVSHLETEFTRTNGETFPVELSAGHFPVGELPAAQLNVRDVTEKRLLEAKFLRAQRLESIGALAGGIAHDLNNVLSPILMGSQLLKRFPDDKRKDQWIESLASSADRGKAIVKQILSFARGTETEHATLKVDDIVAEVRNLIEDTFPPAIEIRIQTGKNLNCIHGNATQIHQILMNLCVNARDAMPEGGLLKIGMENTSIKDGETGDHPDAKPGNYVAVSVSDSGVGMSKEVQARIFDPFFTTKEIDRGTGLGLATVVSIVKGHAGFLTVDSDLGIGTTFTVHFPAHEFDTELTASAIAPELPQGNGELILLGDRDDTIREITQMTLEHFGYRVVSGKDGPEIVALCAQNINDISLALVDIMMPLLDGPALLRTLQRLSPNLELLVMCGSVEHEKVTAVMESQKIDYLIKPFDADELILAVHKSIQKR